NYVHGSPWTWTWSLTCTWTWSAFSFDCGFAAPGESVSHCGLHVSQFYNRNYEMVYSGSLLFIHADTLEVSSRLGLDTNRFPRLDELRDQNLDSVFQCRGLRRAVLLRVNRLRRLPYLQINELRKDDADRFSLEELDRKQHLGQQELHRRADHAFGKRNLFETFGVHAVILVSVLIEVLHHHTLQV